jgi:hypothetical protein
MNILSPRKMLIRLQMSANGKEKWPQRRVLTTRVPPTPLLQQI